MEPSPWQGTVRTLGWENLPFSSAIVSSAVVATLDRLCVPYTAQTKIEDTVVSFILEPVQPLSSASAVCEETLALSPPPSPLRISIQIFAAESENAGKHHVRVRRTQGSHWRFQAFYTEFRRAFSAQLGLADEKVLSTFSPMLPKRVVENSPPTVGWDRRRSDEPACSWTLAKRPCLAGLDRLSHSSRKPRQPESVPRVDSGASLVDIA